MRIFFSFGKKFMKLRIEDAMASMISVQLENYKQTKNNQMF